MVRARIVFLVFALLACLAGCGSKRPPPPRNLPAPTQSTTVGVGDVFDVFVMGEKDIPQQYRVQPDGSIDFPYIKRLQVAGLEPQEIVDELKKKLVEAKVLTDPQVTLIVRQYNSKKVMVIGQVAKPGTLPYEDGMKIVDALSQAGWFTPLADSDHIVLTRTVGPKKTVTAIISVDAITDGAQADVPLQAGDTIKVDARAF